MRRRIQAPEYKHVCTLVDTCNRRACTRMQTPQMRAYTRMQAPRQSVRARAPHAAADTEPSGAQDLSEDSFLLSPVRKA